MGEALENGDIQPTSLQRLGATRPPDHHVFPQQHGQWFRDRGVEPDDFTSRMAGSDHEAIHKAGYNEEWKSWMKANPDASRDQILKQGETMADKYEFGGKDTWRKYQSEE